MRFIEQLIYYLPRSREIKELAESLCLSVTLSVRPSVSQSKSNFTTNSKFGQDHLSIEASVAHHSLCVCNQWVFAGNRADAVDLFLRSHCYKSSLVNGNFKSGSC